MRLTKTRKPKRNFAPGPSLADSAALHAWLEAHPNAYLRLPVVIVKSTDGLPGHELAYIGTEPASPPEGAILLDLDDSTLGIGLSDRLRSLCDSESAACVVWIEGTWGRVAPAFGAQEPTPWPFTVRDVGPLVEDSPQAILVAGRSASTS